MHMSESSSTGFDIDPEFISENSRANLVKPRKKFAPYTKTERLKRRKEVYRLHFDLGVPAIRIADMMNVDKNTINNDIQLLYRELRKSQESIHFEDFYAQQMARIGSQRSRLMSYLEKTDTVEKKLAIERSIADIDFRAMAASFKISTGTLQFQDALIREVNEILEDKKLNYRFSSIYEFLKVSTKGRKIIDAWKKERMV